MTLRNSVLALTLWAALVATSQSQAGVLMTDDAGLGQPQSTIQPSLALTPLINISGNFTTLGEIRYFAGNFAPVGWVKAEGQLVSINSNTSLFSKIGTIYGGDGRTTFALPDLRGRTATGSGTGAGLTPTRIGAEVGTESVSFDLGNLATHNHSLPGGGSTSDAGLGSAYTNIQPGLVINYGVAYSGLFPSRGGSGISDPITPTLGFIDMFASNRLPDDYVSAEGQLVSISQNQALFAIFGTTFGGDGRTTFGLPDLAGRVPIGTDSLSDLGDESGLEFLTMSTDEMVSHLHGLSTSSNPTGATGGGVGETNMQPTTGLQYLIRTEGLFPSRGDGSTSGGSSGQTDSFIGEIGLFGGNFAPGGWMVADGQLLQISQHTALFSILGTTYGGDGRTTFALPDMSSLLAVGAGHGPGLMDWRLGQQFGSTDNFMTLGQLPTHNHNYLVPDPSDVPEPAILGFLVFGIAGLGVARRRRSV